VGLNAARGWAFCVQNGSVREVRLELEFKQYEVYEEKMRGVY
jgi:hypothetical protein